MATIGSEGILGGKYIRLKPGQAAETLPEGGLEDQVGEIIFLATGGK